MPIVPVARAMYLCDYHIGYSTGKVDLYGLFDTIRPEGGFPFTTGRFCVFVQLTNGLGQVPFHVDVRWAETDDLVWTSQEHHLNFPDRTTLVQLALLIEGCPFARPGLYVLELICNNAWVCDTPLFLRFRQGRNGHE